MTRLKQNPAYEPVDFFERTMTDNNPRRGLTFYRAVLKEEGWKGLFLKLGPKAAILLFLFFLGKGLVWLFIFYGGYELIKNTF